MKINILNKSILTVFVLSLAFSLSAQEDWKVPAEESVKTCSKPFNSTMQMNGKDIFNKNCKSCHGDIGKNNFVPLSPEPGDPASEKFRNDSDGDLFYKITNGKGAMPKFKDQLGEDQRWAVISYIRSFHPDYVPAEGGEAVPATAAFNGKDLKLNVTLDKENYEVTTKVTGNVEGQMLPANGVRVGFFIKRNFGMLPVSESVTTDDNGIAKAVFPNDLPGDSIGNYNIVVKLIDNDLYGDVEHTETVAWGKSFIYENPLDKREMWGNRGNSPLWLLFAYFGMLLSAFAVIGYVMLQLKKLKSLGKK